MNNSFISISEIGQTDTELGMNEGLQCITNKTSNGSGEWYFPNGVAVPIEGNAPRSFYQNRSDDGTVNLYRVNETVTSPTGRFCCVVPDDTDVNQTLYINITDVNQTLYTDIIELEATTSKSSGVAVMCVHAGRPPV